MRNKAPKDTRVKPIKNQDNKSKTFKIFLMDEEDFGSFCSKKKLPTCEMDVIPKVFINVVSPVSVVGLSKCVLPFKSYRFKTELSGISSHLFLHHCMLMAPKKMSCLSLYASILCNQGLA